MLKTAYIDRMSDLLGNQLSEYLAAMRERPTRALRLNRIKASEKILSALPARLTPTPYEPSPYYADTDVKIGNHPLHHAGAIYVQEPSAMMPIAAASIPRGARVLDLCASPGGKSAQIAERIGDEGLLVSNEIVPARCATLAGNIERLGILNAIVTCTDAQTLGASLPSFFDVILVDAPCSGEGMLRKLPEAAEEWTPSLPDVCAARGREILDAILPALRPGGLLIYSTCTFSPEENEGIVSYLLKTHPDFALEAPTPDVLPFTAPASAAHCPKETDPALMRRFYPHLAKGEGQFCALLRRAEGTVTEKRNKRERGERKKEAFSQADTALLRQFLSETLTETPRYSLSLFKGNAVLSPFELPLETRHIYANGVTVGEIQKGRVIPHHAFFSAYGSQFRRKIDLSPDDPCLAAYLHGDTFACGIPSGYAAVTVLGVPLGGIKVSGGIAKNHYPKGLRRQG